MFVLIAIKDTATVRVCSNISSEYMERALNVNVDNRLNGQDPEQLMGKHALIGRTGKYRIIMKSAFPHNSLRKSDPTSVEL